jgi:hypothetical protein
MGYEAAADLVRLGHRRLPVVYLNEIKVLGQPLKD